jgi:hypothetical protein
MGSGETKEKEVSPAVDWANDPDYDDEGNLDVEWYPDPQWLQDYDKEPQTDRARAVSAEADKTED